MNVDSKLTTFVIMVGDRIIGDKACYRIGNQQEVFFEPISVNRDEIVKQGKSLIKTALKEKRVTTKSGLPYPWDLLEPSDC